MTRAQRITFWILSSALTVVIVSTVVTSDSVNAASVGISIVSAALCSLAIFFWVKLNPREVEVLMSNEPDWLVWGKNKHGFTVFSLHVMAWSGMMLEDYLTIGSFTIARTIGFLLSLLLLALFVRECLRPRESQRDKHGKS